MEDKIREAARIRNEQYIAKKVGVTKLHLTLEYVYSKAEPALPKRDGGDGTDIDHSRANDSQMNILQQSQSGEKDKKSRRLTH